MIKLLIADDEAVFRKGLLTSIHWNLYGIHVVGEAKNGQEALEKALTLQPDIILIDIRMPIMDGLSAAKQIRDKLPLAKIIILSGYDDFDYAKQALHIGVNDYLLKPFGADELLELMMRLKEKIIAQQKQLEDEIQTRNIMEENILLLQVKLIQTLLNEAYDDDKYIFEEARLIRLNLEGPFYQIIVFNIDDQDLLMENLSYKEKEFIKNSALCIASEVLQQYLNGTFCKTEMDYYVGLLNRTENSQVDMMEICREIKDAIQKYLKITITIGIGDTCPNIKGIASSFQNALHALRQKVYQGKNSIIDIKDVPQNIQIIPMSYPVNEERLLLTALKEIDENRIYNIISGTFAEFKKNRISEGEVKNYCIKLTSMSLNTLESMGVSIREQLGKDLNLYAEIKKHETIDGLEQWIKELLQNLIQNLNIYKAQKYKQIISTAIDYIHHHYHENITLKTLSDIVYVTPNYLSRTFKAETGENFVEWLNKFRIEKAKGLLKDHSLKTYEIAEKVGYSDYKYFSNKFKKYTGQSAREYLEENK
jgi:two-component system, response regulator YesN